MRFTDVNRCIRVFSSFIISKKIIITHAHTHVGVWNELDRNAEFLKAHAALREGIPSLAVRIYAEWCDRNQKSEKEEEAEDATMEVQEEEKVPVIPFFN